MFLAFGQFANAAWRCSARGIVDYSYDGGGSATIHLKGYSSGNSYPVNKKGRRATGVMTNGTPFTCTEQ